MTDLIQQAKDEIWQAAVESSKAILMTPGAEQLIAIYFIYAQTTSLIAIDPSMDDAAKLAAIKQGAYSFIRGILSGTGVDVSTMTDEAVVQAYVNKLQGIPDIIVPATGDLK